MLEKSEKSKRSIENVDGNPSVANYGSKSGFDIKSSSFLALQISKSMPYIFFKAQ